MKNLSRAIGGLVAALAMTLPAYAATTTLADLLGGATITAGDKSFDNWTLLGYDSSDINRVLNAAKISVTSLDDGGDNPGPGLSFSISDGELSVLGDGTFAYVDLAFGFRASVLPGAGKLIKDNSLAYNDLGAFYGFNSNETGAGPLDAGSFIKEYIDSAGFVDLSNPNPDLGDKDIEFSYADGVGEISKISDSAEFVPHSSVWVTKNILAWASAPTDSAGVTGFNQRFSQQPVPEPGSLALVAVALAGLGAVARRRRG